MKLLDQSLKITIIVPAYNEEECIGDNIRNKLELKYPGELKEIIVVSDASEDRTADIVKEYEKDGVILIERSKRAGKTAALNFAVTQASGDIIVFADANSIYAPGALEALAQNFHDQAVGYVTGKMIYAGDSNTVVGGGCSAYMRYENSIRHYETQIGSIVGVDGGVDAIRRELYTPMKHDQLPDFVLPLHVILKGYRVVYEPEAILKEEMLKEEKDEYRMRVRVALRALWALYDLRKVLFLPHNLIFSWQVWSHKVLRYSVFLFLILAFISNLLLATQSSQYLAVFILHCLFYVVASLPFITKKDLSCNRFIHFANYFCLVNFAFMHAFMKFLFGKKIVTWTPRKG